MSNNNEETKNENTLKTPELRVKNDTTTERHYAILMETSGEEFESWYSFIKYEGNEDALAHLNKQLEQVEWYILNDLSTFDLEMENLVCEKTAKEMINVDLNHYSFHRKFDGTLQKVDLGFKNHHTNEKKMLKAFEVLGYGKIENFIDAEDVDKDALVSCSESEDEEEETESEDEETESEESESEEEEKTKKNTEKKKGKLPAVLMSKKVLEMPGFAKAKAKRRHKN